MPIPEEVEEYFTKPLMKYTWYLAIFGSLFILLSFNSPVMVFLGKLSLFGITILYLAYFYHFKHKQVILYFLSLFFILLILIPVNFLYINLEMNFPYKFTTPQTFSPDYWLKFGFQMFLISASSIVAFVMTVVYYKRKGTSIFEAQKRDKVRSMFSFFMIDTNWKKVIVLIGFLLFASFNEEMIYRYFIVNLMGAVHIPAIIIIIANGIIFGLAHRNNGVMSYVFSSAFSGAVFCWNMLEFGVAGSWILHMAWNCLVTIEDKINIWISDQ
jgi:membrane protease YdiL (CAAX protease family)